MSAPFVLSAGGTGGHLFPAQALAAELHLRGGRVVVMTDGRGSNYGEAFPGAEISLIPAATFVGRSVLGRIAALGEIALGVVAAFAKLLKLKPRAVVGFGGYPSLPVMLAASAAGYPTALHEQNAVPGRVNRLLAGRVKRIAASFAFARYAPKDGGRIVFTGNPIRPEARRLARAPYAPPTADGPIRLLVFGGSQGARALSEIVPAALARLPDALRRRLAVIQQCRPEDIQAVRAVYAGAGIGAEIARFYADLPQRMADAHLVISRSGASTVAELAAIGRPAILVPYPFATDDHQSANAAVIADAGAGWACPQDTLDADTLARLLENIFSHPADLAARAASAAQLGKPDAAARLADLVERLSDGNA